MKFHRNAIWLIPLAFVVSFPLWSIPIGKFLTPRGGFDPNVNNVNDEQQNFTMQTVTILQNQKGKDTAKIRAAKARTNPDNLNIVILEKVNAEVYDDSGNITLITSQKGKYNMANKTLTLVKDVILSKPSEKQFLYTELLVYNSEQRTVNCPADTKVKSESGEINSGSLNYDITNQTYVFGKRVKCLIQGFIKP